MFSRIILSLSLVLCSWTVTGFSSEEAQREILTEERSAVGERPLSQEKQEVFDQQIEDAISELREQMDPNASAEENIQPLALHPAGYEVRPVYYNNALHNHWLYSLSPDGRFIEIEDKSRFEVAPSHAHISMRWYADHSYTITPNYNWFTYQNYAYTINNNTSGESVKANLILGPELNNPYAHWVISVNYALGRVYLANGTVWEVSSRDMGYLYDWAINDYVIIGNYSPWMYCLYPYDSILINVNMNHYIHVRQV